MQIKFTKMPTRRAEVKKEENASVGEVCITGRNVKWCCHRLYNRLAAPQKLERCSAVLL